MNNALPALMMVADSLPPDVRQQVNDAPYEALRWVMEHRPDALRQAMDQMGQGASQLPGAEQVQGAWQGLGDVARGVHGVVSGQAFAPWFQPPPEDNVGGGQDRPMQMGKYRWDIVDQPFGSGQDVGAGQYGGSSSGGMGGGGTMVPGGYYGQGGKWATQFGSTGIDIFAPQGTPVQAPGDGQIVMGSMGLLLKLNNGPYMRLVHVQPNVSPGQRVHKGDPIAIIGDPSLSQSYQHADVAFSSSPNNWQMNGPAGPGGMGGDIDARQVLQQLGIQERVIPGATGGIAAMQRGVDPPGSASIDGQMGASMGGGMMGGMGGGGGMGMPGGMGGMGMPGGMGGMGMPGGMGGMGGGMPGGMGGGMMGGMSGGMGGGMGMPGGMGGMMGGGPMGMMGGGGGFPGMGGFGGGGFGGGGGGGFGGGGFGGMGMGASPFGMMGGGPMGMMGGGGFGGGGFGGGMMGDAMPKSPGMQRAQFGGPPNGPMAMPDMNAGAFMSGMGMNPGMMPPFGGAAMSGMGMNPGMFPPFNGAFMSGAGNPGEMSPFGGAFMSGMGSTLADTPMFGGGQDTGSGQDVGVGQFGGGMGGGMGGMMGGMGGMGGGMMGGGMGGMMGGMGGGGMMGGMGGMGGGMMGGMGGMGGGGMMGGMGGGMDMGGMGMPMGGMGAPPTITTTPADTFMNNAFNWRPDLTAWNKVANFPNLDMSAIQAANSIGAARQNADFAPWLPAVRDNNTTTPPTTELPPPTDTNPLTNASGVPWTTLFPTAGGPWFINGARWDPATQAPPWEGPTPSADQKTGTGQDVGVGQFGGGMGGGGNFGGTLTANPLEAGNLNLNQQQFQQGVNTSAAQLQLQQQQLLLQQATTQATIQQMNQQYKQAQASLYQQWLVHRDDSTLQQQSMQLQEEFNRRQLQFQQQAAQIQVAQQNVTNQMQAYGINAQQLQNANQNQLAAGQMAQQQQQAGFGRQMDIFHSAMSNPWTQQLTGMAPQWGAPGGPQQAGMVAAQGGANLGSPPQVPQFQQMPSLLTPGNVETNFSMPGPFSFGALPSANQPTATSDPFALTGTANTFGQQPAAPQPQAPMSAPTPYTAPDPNASAQFTGGGQDVGAGQFGNTGSNGFDFSSWLQQTAPRPYTPPPSQQTPTYQQFSHSDPFSQAGYLSNQMLQGLSQPQVFQNLRYDWANNSPNSQAVTGPQNLTQMSMQGLQNNPLDAMSFGNTLSVFGQTPGEYSATQTPQWMQSNQANVAGLIGG
jgi:hypothetical protein